MNALHHQGGATVLSPVPAGKDPPSMAVTTDLRGRRPLAFAV